MGIQDRDYFWKDRYQPSSENELQPYMPPKKLGLLARYPWVVPLLWGFVLGKNWEKIKLLGSLVYAKYVLPLL